MTTAFSVSDPDLHSVFGILTPEDPFSLTVIDSAPLQDPLTSPFYFSSRKGFSVALEPVLELALVEQAGFELTENHLLLTPECWD